MSVVKLRGRTFGRFPRHNAKLCSLCCGKAPQELLRGVAVSGVLAGVFLQPGAPGAALAEQSALLARPDGGVRMALVRAAARPPPSQTPMSTGWRPGRDLTAAGCCGRPGPYRPDQPEGIPPARRRPGPPSCAACRSSRPPPGASSGRSPRGAEATGARVNAVSDRTPALAAASADMVGGPRRAAAEPTLSSRVWANRADQRPPVVTDAVTSTDAAAVTGAGGAVTPPCGCWRGGWLGAL